MRAAIRYASERERGGVSIPVAIDEKNGTMCRSPDEP